MKECKILPLGKKDSESVLEIFNYYVENTFAAYPDKKVPTQVFDAFLGMSEGYPTGKIVLENDSFAGFGMLRPYYNSHGAFSHVAEVTYFIHREYTGKGLGTSLLEYLESEGRKRGVTLLLASISSRNFGSINFHAQNGFRKCGHFEGVVKKNGLTFDMVWMQKAVNDDVCLG